MIQDNLTILVLSEKDKPAKKASNLNLLQIIKFLACFSAAVFGMCQTFQNLDSFFFAIFFVLYFLSFELIKG